WLLLQQPVRLDWAIYGSHAPFYMALDEKMYEKAGLDVSIGEGQGSATVAKIVGQGNDPIGFIDFTSTIRAVEQGIPLIAIGRVISNVMCIISHADAPIRAPNELEGKVVAYAPAESTGQMLAALLQQNNVDASKINVLNPATGAKNAVFLQGRAEAIPANVNVQVAQLEAQGAKLHYFLFSDFGVHMMNNGIVANANWVQQNRDAAKAFVHASLDAFKASKEDPEKAIDLLIKRVPQQARNKSVLRRQLELTFPSLETRSTKGRPFGLMADQDWQQTQHLLLKHGGLPKAVELSKLYTNEFVEL
ncbi:ABC transporter substrate-binding protein, partial [Bradyrhizobium vignae]